MEKQRCNAMVYNTFVGSRCASGALLLSGDGKWYCKTHCPEEIDKRGMEKQEKLNADKAAREKTLLVNRQKRELTQYRAEAFILLMSDIKRLLWEGDDDEALDAVKKYEYLL